MNLRHRHLQLRQKIWLYFMLFVGIVFILMWLFQVVFLEHFYEYIKIRDTEKVANNLIHAYHAGSFRQTALNIGLSNDLCIELMDKNGKELYAQCMYSHNCLLHSTDSDPFFYLVDLQHSKTGTICRSVFNQNMQNNMIVYGKVMQNDNHDVVGYLLLNSPLVPVESTVSILKRQAMSITLILVFLGCVISFCVARHIARPITRITKSAHRLAHGDYQTVFEGGGYAEVDELAQTLTYAEQELSKTDAMQRDLIANVSHDLRTPLTMLKAYAEMIRDLSGNNPVKREQHLNVIIEETDRLSQLVNDMLDLSKLESGTQKLERTEFDIAVKMEEIAHRYQGISEQMGYHLHFTPDASCMVYCDEGKIERVICNLIHNAINYTSKEDRQIFLRQINTPEGVRIEVTDTGDGIEENKIKLIFDKYYRSENHKREVVGTGLGLSIVKAILKLHNYHYGVNSKLGEGSTFWFVIRDVKTDSTESSSSSSKK